MKAKFLFSVYLLFFTAFINAQDGSFDPTFNSGSLGFNDNNGNTINDFVTQIFTINSGSIYVCGGFKSYNGSGKKGFIKLNPNGSLDTSFATRVFGSFSFVKNFVVQPDGKIIITGSFTSYDGIVANNIARLNTDGSLDTSFSTGTGFLGGAYISKIRLQSDGKIIISGNFTNYNGTLLNRKLIRINVDGSLDTTFNAFGTDANNFIYHFDIQSDDKIIIVGDFTTYNSISAKRIARLNADGSFDATFTTAAVGFNSSAYCIKILNNGKFLVGGSFGTYNGSNTQKFIRLNTDGTLDASFNTTVASYPSPESIDEQPDSKILITASITGGGSISLVRLNNNGTIDTTLDDGLGPNGPTRAIALQNGKILIGGSFGQYNGNLSPFLARVNNSSTLSLDEFTNDNEVLVYPNPTNDFINIKWNSTAFSETNYSLFDVAGRIVLKGTINNIGTIDIAILPSSLYFLRLDKSGKTIKIFKTQK
jgi:uncharacterized delta-60 repeat protein